MMDWPLLELPPDRTDDQLIAFCWEYFRQSYMQDAHGKPIVIRDWRGVLVRFSRFAHDHIVSGDKDYREGLGLHELPFVRERAERLPRIGPTLAGQAVTEVRAQERAGFPRSAAQVAGVDRDGELVRRRSGQAG